MAPYNTQYERLPVHMAKAGVTAEPNLWDRPVTLGREHRPATPDSDSATSAAGKARMPFTLLPPDKLLPLMVPFKGGPGPLCGGAASGGGSRWGSDLQAMSQHPPERPAHVFTDPHVWSRVRRDLGACYIACHAVCFLLKECKLKGVTQLQGLQLEAFVRVVFRMSADVGSFVGLGDGGGGGSGPLAPSPFRLPAVYEEAKERKVSAVSDLRNAVKAVCSLQLPQLCPLAVCISDDKDTPPHIPLLTRKLDAY